MFAKNSHKSRDIETMISGRLVGGPIRKKSKKTTILE